MRNVLIVVAAVSLGVSAASGFQSSATRSVRDGVYTNAQAARGGSFYEEHCAGCHAARMWGADWPEKSIWDVFDMISNYMPADDPGSLSAQQYRDLVAYILKTNKLPAGKSELPESADDLKTIRFEAPVQ